MKIIILAAGLGSRLREGESDSPKPLTILSNGQSILQQQIKNLSRKFCVDDIYVVVGYKMNLIMEQFPHLCYVYNQDFSSTNTSKSLLKGLRKVKDESVLWLNGDVVFSENLLEKTLDLVRSEQSFVCVNDSKVGEEEVKYNLDTNGNIRELSKQVENPLGEAVGINFIAKSDVEKFKAALDNCDDNDYFEKGLEALTIEESLSLIPLDISEFYCMEVDFQEDLEKVNDFLK